MELNLKEVLKNNEIKARDQLEFDMLSQSLLCWIYLTASSFNKNLSINMLIDEILYFPDFFMRFSFNYSLCKDTKKITH